MKLTVKLPPNPVGIPAASLKIGQMARILGTGTVVLRTLSHVISLDNLYDEWESKDNHLQSKMVEPLPAGTEVTITTETPIIKAF